MGVPIESLLAVVMYTPGVWLIRHWSCSRSCAAVHPHRVPHGRVRAAWAEGLSRAGEADDQLPGGCHGGAAANSGAVRGRVPGRRLRAGGGADQRLRADEVRTGRPATAG